MSLRRRSTLRFLIAASVIAAIFVPEIPALRPFHPSLLPLALAVLFASFSLPQVLAIVGLILLSYLGSAFSIFVYGLPPGGGFLWAAFPIVILLLSYFITLRLRLSAATLYRLLVIYGIILGGFVLLQIFYPGFGVLRLYVSEAKSEVWTRYAMVIAPIGNPNNTALVLSLIAIALQSLALGGIHRQATKQIRSNQGLLSSRVVLLNLLVVLSVGIFFAYARTVVAAFLVAESVFVLTRLRSKRRVQALLLLLGLALVAYLIVLETGSERQIQHYAEMLNPTRASSFTIRYNYLWKNSWELLRTRALLLGTGVGWYEGALQEAQGTLVIDSAYLYLLVAHGVLVLLAFISITLYVSMRYRALLPLTTILLISGTTLPYLSDYRLNIIIGFLMGALLALVRTPSPFSRVQRPRSPITCAPASVHSVHQYETSTANHTARTGCSSKGAR